MTIEKLPGATPDTAKQNIARLAELFPECLTEGPAGTASDRGEPVIDWDLLKQALSDHLVEGPQERYRLDWPGKRQALLSANAPISKTLRPMREESVDFDTTRNLFIEGDNLDALKLLQETYLGKVKMIYIDPPYNTGKDFVYKDNFFQSSGEYEVGSGQRSEEGGRLVANPETNGRFHSDWLSMMYPRLKLARNFLSENGAIFISISDKEVAAVTRQLDEIFGEPNRLGVIVWNNVTDNNPTNIASEHEYILCYARDISSLEKVWKSSLSAIKDQLVRVGDKLIEQYGDTADLRSAYSAWFKDHKDQIAPLDGYKHIDIGGIYTGSRRVHNPGREGYKYDIIHPDTKQVCKPPLMGYRFPKETFEKMLAEGRIIFGKDHNKIIEVKVYAKEFSDKLSSVLRLDGRSGAYDLRKLFEDELKVFDNPKPVALLQMLFDFATDKNSLVMDFFSGSATSAEAVFRLNAEDGGNRSWILVQLPEVANEGSGSKLPEVPTEGAGSQLISNLSRERIRRAAAKILSEYPELIGKLDTGFRGFRIDVGNFQDTRITPQHASQDTLAGMISHIKDDRTDEDLFFGALLRWGVDITLPIRKGELAGRTVWFVDPPAEGEDGAAVIACLARPQNGKGGVDTDLADAIAALKPLRALFRDDGFASDAAKENVASRFKQISPDTTLRVL